MEENYRKQIQKKLVNLNLNLDLNPDIINIIDK